MYKTLNLFFSIQEIFLDSIKDISKLLPSDREGLYWGDSQFPCLLFKNNQDKEKMLLSNPCVRDLGVVEIPQDFSIPYEDLSKEQKEEHIKNIFKQIELEKNRYDINFRVCSGYHKKYLEFKTKVIILPKQDISEGRSGRFIPFFRMGENYTCKHFQGRFECKFLDEVVFPEIDKRLPNTFKELAPIMLEFGFKVMPRFKFLL